MTEQELYRKALDTFGNKQLDMLVEECAELIKAVMKLRRIEDHGTDVEFAKAMENFIEEQIDVEIMIGQMKERNPMLGMRARFKNMKLSRLAKLLGETYEQEAEHA